MIVAKVDLVKIHGATLSVKDGRELLDITDCGLFKGQSGARYLDLTLWDTQGGQYGDWRITQDLGREARAAGKKGAILGNGKNKGQAAQSQPPKPKTGNQTGTIDDSSDVPY